MPIPDASLRVQADMYPLLLECTTEGDKSLCLYRGLATAEGNPTSLAEEGTFADGSAEYLTLLDELPSLPYGDGVGVGTVEALEVAALKEDHETKAWTVKGTHGLKGMNTKHSWGMSRTGEGSVDPSPATCQIDIVRNEPLAHALVEGARDDLELMLTAELDEVHRIARDSDGELRVVLWVLHSILEHLSVEHVHIEVMCPLGEVAIHHRDEVLDLLVLVRAQGVWNDAEGIADPVCCVRVVELGHRAKRGDCTVIITAVHGVSSRSEGYTCVTSIGRSTGLLAVHHVGGDC